MGVSYENPRTWVAKWQDVKGNQCKKCFSLKKYRNDNAKVLAIKHRQKMIWSLPHYREALQLDAETQ